MFITGMPITMVIFLKISKVGRTQKHAINEFYLNTSQTQRIICDWDEVLQSSKPSEKQESFLLRKILEQS